MQVVHDRLHEKSQARHLRGRYKRKHALQGSSAACLIQPARVIGKEVATHSLFMRNFLFQEVKVPVT